MTAASDLPGPWDEQHEITRGLRERFMGDALLQARYVAAGRARRARELGDVLFGRDRWRHLGEVVPPTYRGLELRIRHAPSPLVAKGHAPYTWLPIVPAPPMFTYYVSSDGRGLSLDERLFLETFA